MTTNRVTEFLAKKDEGLTPEEAARRQAAAIHRRFQYQLHSMGGIDSVDFLDIPREQFLSLVRVYFYGRLAQ